MKRFLSTLLAVVMVLALAAPAIAESRAADTALRATPAFTLTADKDQVQQGENVTLTMTLTGNYTATTINTKLYYDADKFEYVSHAGGTVYTTAQATGNAMCIIQHMANDHFLTCGIAMYSGSFSTEGVVYTLTLKAKTDAALGEVTFTPEMVDFSFLGENPPAVAIDHTINGCTVEIVEAVVPEGVVISVVPSKTTVQPGETFTVAMNISGDYAAAELSFRFPFDRNLFTAGAATPGAVMVDVDEDGGEATASAGARYYTVSLVMGNNPISATGTICTFTFTVKDGAEGSYIFDPTNVDFYDTNDDDIEYTTVPGEVTIGAEDRPVVFTATASKTEVMPGETFTVDFSISGTYEAHAITWQLSTDPDLFETVSLTEGPVIAAARTAGGTAMAEASNLKTVIIMPTDPLTAEGVIFTATFTVKSGATGSYTFTPNIIRFSNYPAGGTETPIDYSVETSTVTIAAAEPVVLKATASKTELQPGETFTVDFSITGTYAAHTVNVLMSVDTDLFDIVSVAEGEIITAARAAGGTAMINNNTLEAMIIMPTDPVTATGVLYTATLQVKAGATGSYTFTPSVKRFTYYPAGGTETAIEYSVETATVNITAAEPVVLTATASKAQVEQGETFTVEYSVSGSYAAHTFNVLMSVDTDRFEIVSVAEGEVIAAARAAGGSAMINNSTLEAMIIMPTDPLTAEGVIFTVTLQVKDDATGTYTFTPSVKRLTYYPAGGNETAIEYEVVGAPVEIIEVAPATYTITWKVEGQDDVTTTVEEGQTPEYPYGTPVKSGDAQYTYTFAGWTPDVVPATADATYTATWTQTVNTYTITWDVDGETTTETYEYGATPVYPNGTPTKPADAEHTYSFAGWDPAITAVTGDATYTATWATDTVMYTITWVIDDVTETQQYAYGATPAHADPTKEATAQYTYTFAGWDPEIAPVTGDATYTATWNQTVNTYTITWNIDGQTETETYEYGATPAHADPTKENGDHVMYTFAGWTPEIAPVTGDATYTATWNETPFGSVTYLVNGIQIAKLENVTEMTEDMVPAGIAWYGFVFKSWDKTVEQINAELAQGNDVTVNGVMEVAVNNIHLTIVYDDETVEKDYTESRWVTVTALPQNEDGQYFQYWTIDNVIISYSPKASIRIVASCTLEAHYGDEQLEAVGVAQLLKADYDNLNKREIFVAYMSAPDGASVTAAGLYAAPGTEYDPANGELTAANAKYVKNLTITDATKPCTYTWYKSNVNEGDVWYVRVFVTYELDGETTTILGETTAITAGTNYVAGN